MRHEDELCRPASLWHRLVGEWLSEEDQVAEASDKVAEERPGTGDEMAA
jgi:hypothetical protein